MRIVDGHLDLATNALEYERDQTLPVEVLRQREEAGVQDGRGRAGVSLPELRASHTPLVVATLVARAKPWIDPSRTLKRGGDWPAQCSNGSNNLAEQVTSTEMALLASRSRSVMPPTTTSSS